MKTSRRPLITSEGLLEASERVIGVLGIAALASFIFIAFSSQIITLNTEIQFVACCLVGVFIGIPLSIWEGR